MLLEQTWNTRDVAERVRAEMRRAELQVGGAFAIEAEAALAVRVQRDEGERGVAASVRTTSSVPTPAWLQAVQQEVAEAVARQHAGKARRAAERVPPPRRRWPVRRRQTA